MKQIFLAILILLTVTGFSQTQKAYQNPGPGSRRFAAFHGEEKAFSLLTGRGEGV